MRPGPFIASLLTVPALAQGIHWQLPERGGALYRRDLRVESKTEPAGVELPELWAGEPQPGTVLAGELDGERLRRSAPLWDLRELVADLGLDLTVIRAGKVRAGLRFGDRFHPTSVELTLGPLSDEGRQDFTATIDVDAKLARAQGAPPPDALRLRGRVQGCRVVDRQKGIVTRIEGKADLTVEWPDDRSHPLRRQVVQLADAWSDPLVTSMADAEFRARVAIAIKKSVAFLREQLDQRLATPFEGVTDAYHDVQSGELALMLLALVHAGEDRRDSLVQRGFDMLRRRIITDTYSLAVAVLAIESLYTPPGEWAELRAGKIKAPLPRALSAGDLELVRGWARALQGNVDSSVDASALRRWSYGPAKAWDNSNSQYALLGLYGASLCGADVPAAVWSAAAGHWLKCAIAAGPADVPDLVHHRELEQPARTRTGSRVPPRAWSYGAGDAATGSMTAAGIGALTLCNAALRLQKKGGAELLADIDTAVRGGFLWLQHEFTVRRSCGPIEQSVVWHLYYLYGLERACELNQVALLGGRDWYFEGALQLLATQGGDGSWTSANDTAFALLFLKKAVLPAITGR